MQDTWVEKTAQAKKAELEKKLGASRDRIKASLSKSGDKIGGVFEKAFDDALDDAVRKGEKGILDFMSDVTSGNFVDGFKQEYKGAGNACNKEIWDMCGSNCGGGVSLTASLKTNFLQGLHDNCHKSCVQEHMVEGDVDNKNVCWAAKDLAWNVTAYDIGKARKYVEANRVNSDPFVCHQEGEVYSGGERRVKRPYNQDQPCCQPHLRVKNSSKPDSLHKLKRTFPWFGHIHCQRA